MHTGSAERSSSDQPEPNGSGSGAARGYFDQTAREYSVHEQGAMEAALEEAAKPVQRARRSRGSIKDWLARSPATYLLLAVNVGVYLGMVLAGVDPLTPSPDDLVHFGANYPLAVLVGHQWWRIITAMFVHVGILHLAANMWCLWNLGVIGEPLLGMFGVLSVYVLTGAAGNLLSLTFNGRGQVGAGASGAVFGIAGILIVLFSNKRLAEPRPGFLGIPLEDLRAIRRSVISFAALNLLIGAGTTVGPLMRGIHLEDLHIDNMAHIGGFASGLAMGVPLLPRMTSGRAPYLQRQKVVFAAAALLLSLFGYFLANLQ
jgi:rhomboid protease GluP